MPTISDNTVRTLARYVGVSVLMYAAVGVSFHLLGLRGAPVVSLFVFYAVVYLVDFLINRIVVFQAGSRGAFPRFLVTTIASIGLLSLTTGPLSELDIPTVTVPIVASAIVFPIRFLAYRYWVYSERV